MSMDVVRGGAALDAAPSCKCSHTGDRGTTLAEAYGPKVTFLVFQISSMFWKFFKVLSTVNSLSYVFHLEFLLSFMFPFVHLFLWSLYTV